jgi:hypothetical protein
LGAFKELPPPFPLAGWGAYTKENKLEIKNSNIKINYVKYHFGTA